MARGWPRVTAAAAGGILYFLGYLGYGVWPCLLVFLVPLWWALEDAPTGRAGGRGGLRRRRLRGGIHLALVSRRSLPRRQRPGRRRALARVRRLVRDRVRR